MERKALAAAELKMLDDGPGSFTGYASRWDELDSEGDVVAKGAYADTLDAFRQRGFISWSHDWASPVATIKDAREDGRGLFLEAEFHSDPQSQVARTRTAERLARGKFMGLSIGYVPLEFDRTAKGRRLTRIELFETSLVTVPALASAGVLAAKEARLDGLVAPIDPDHEARAVWSAAFVNDLPDGAFAVILPGGEKDDEGKTTPRSLRKLPHHGADGAVDLAHLRNGLAREPQTDMPASAHATARAHLRRHASAAGVGEAASADLDAEAKVGRRLSAASEARIRAAMDTLRDLLGESIDAGEESRLGDGEPEAPMAEEAPLRVIGERLATELAGYAARIAAASPADVARLGTGAAGVLRGLATARARLDAALAHASQLGGDPEESAPEALHRRFAALAARFTELDPRTEP